MENLWKISVTRKTALCGAGVKMIVYIDNEEKCRLAERETKVIETNKPIVKFKCKLQLNSMSKEYEINFNNGNVARVFAKSGGVTTKVTINYDNELLCEEKNAVERDRFKPTKKIGNYFWVDEERKQWVIPKKKFLSSEYTIKNAKIHEYSEITEYILLEDGQSITKGGVGNAVVGGLLFGGVGAVVGGITGAKSTNNTCTTLMIKISVNNIQEPYEFINLVNGEMIRSGFFYKRIYKTAQEILSLLQIICSENNKKIEENNNKLNTNISVADELKKFKELLDAGVLTQEEFDEQKKKILN